MKTLSLVYAKKFCEENPPLNIKKRQKYIKLNEHMTVVNGEALCGPSETWPAQLADTVYLTSNNNIEKRFTYENLSKSILLRYPKIQEKRHVSKKEYENTINELFKATIIGFKKSKIESIFQKNLGKEKDEIPYWKKPFINLKEKALKRNSLSARISNFKNMLPLYLHEVRLYLNYHRNL